MTLTTRENEEYTARVKALAHELWPLEPGASRGCWCQWCESERGRSAEESAALLQQYHSRCRVMALEYEKPAPPDEEVFAPWPETDP